MNGPLLEGAATIGALLCRKAYYSNDRCTWVGRAIQESEPGGAPTVSVLGSDLYGGTAGVGLFLSELWAATGESQTRRTALGALRYAQSRASQVPRSTRLGLYSGATGIGLALAWSGAIFGDQTLTEAGTALIHTTCADAVGDEPLDLVSGGAGAIQSLLAIDDLQASNGISLASALADNIVAAGIWHDDTFAWPTTRASGNDLGPRPLTGLSHGAAGIGLALLEVAARTGRTDLREIGEAAFRYEDRWFSAERQNWPDLRSFRISATTATQHSYGVAWCHGAAGIGLARLRARQLFPDDAERWVADIAAAVHTTRRRLTQLLSDRAYDATPCHGIAGLLELLLVASRLLQDQCIADEVLEAWRTLLSFHAARLTWPSGFPSRGSSPSLMLGLAGVGHALLRAACPSTVRSVLLVSGHPAL